MTSQTPSDHGYRFPLGWIKWKGQAHRIGLQQTEQSRDNVPSLQGYRGLSDASERVGGTES